MRGLAPAAGITNLRDSSVPSAQYLRICSSSHLARHCYHCLHTCCSSCSHLHRSCCPHHCHSCCLRPCRHQPLGNLAPNALVCRTCSRGCCSAHRRRQRVLQEQLALSHLHHTMQS